MSSYDTIDRYLCLCLEGTLLEFDLETSTCLREIRAAKDLVCLRYLNNKKRDKSRRRVVGIGRDGYVRCFDLVTGGSVALAFALKKSQTLEGPAQDGVLPPLRVSLAPSYSHAGCFWSIGESRSVYWISISHSRKVLAKRGHVATIEDAFRIKQSKGKSPVASLASSSGLPLLAVGRAAGFVEVFSTDSLKLVQRVQLDCGGLVAMAVSDLVGSLSVCCLSRPEEAAAYALHRIEIGQQDSKKKSKQERKEDKAPRASVCSVDAALLGGRPRLQHLGGRECAATSLEDGTLVVINVSSGEQRVTGAAALEEAKRTADGLMGRHASSPGKANPSAAALVGYSPDWDSLFVCSTSRRPWSVSLELDVFRGLRGMRLGAAACHVACGGGSGESPTRESFRVEVLSYSDTYKSIGVVLTEAEMGPGGAQRTTRAEHKLPEGMAFGANAVERTERSRTASGTHWLLQCECGVVLLVTRRQGGEALEVESLVGTSAAFVGGFGGGGELGVAVLRDSVLEVLFREAAGVATSSMKSSRHQMQETRGRASLVSCEVADGGDTSRLELIWAAEREVFLGGAASVGGGGSLDLTQVQITKRWALGTEHETILDAARMVQAAPDASMAAHLAVLTDRRVVILDRNLAVCGRCEIPQNAGQLAGLHWLQSSKTLACVGRGGVWRPGRVRLDRAGSVP